jgi:hypothetical protein
MPAIGRNMDRPVTMKDLTGLKFGRLIVLRFADYYVRKFKRAPRWKCRCECGAISVVGVRVCAAEARNHAGV